MVEQRVLEQDGKNHATGESQFPLQDAPKRQHESNQANCVRNCIPKAAYMRRTFPHPGQFTINRIDNAFDNQKQTRYNQLVLKNQPGTVQCEKKVKVGNLYDRNGFILEKPSKNSSDWTTPIG